MLILGQVEDADARVEISWMSQRPACPPDDRKLENRNAPDAISFQTAAGKLFAELAWKKSSSGNKESEISKMIINNEGGSCSDSASGLESSKHKSSPSQEEVCELSGDFALYRKNLHAKHPPAICILKPSVEQPSLKLSYSFSHKEGTRCRGPDSGHFG